MHEKKIYGDSTVFCKSDISDKYDISHWKIILDKMMFCWKSRISHELESVIYSFSVSQQFGLDIGGEEKSPVHLLLFQENVKVWIIKIGFNQSFVLGNNLHFFQGKFSAKQLSLDYFYYLY